MSDLDEDIKRTPGRLARRQGGVCRNPAPEGNVFCLIEPGNNFLADCGFIGALACDGSQEVGYFWK